MAPKLQALLKVKALIQSVPEPVQASRPPIAEAVVSVAVAVVASPPPAEPAALVAALLVAAPEARGQQCSELTPEQLLDQLCAAVQP